VLARLNSVAGVREVGVDHRGELLRLVVSDAVVLGAVGREVSGLGYMAVPIEGLVASDVRWYAFDDVRDLSREEAEIIARRVTSRFASTRSLSDADAIRLEHAVAEALYRCFAAHQLASGAPTGTLQSVCCDAAEEAARLVVGQDAAREYASLLSNDLGG